MLIWNKFVNSLGTSEVSAEFIDLISSVGEQPIVSEDPDEYNDIEGKTKYYSFPESGFLLGIRAGALDHVHFYIAGNESYHSYEGPLVNGIDATFNQEKIITMFGTPEKAGGGYPDMLLGYIDTWIRYNMEGYKLRFEFSKDGGLREISILV